jgi:hypothetical protein
MEARSATSSVISTRAGASAAGGCEDVRPDGPLLGEPRDGGICTHDLLHPTSALQEPDNR